MSVLAFFLTAIVLWTLNNLTDCDTNFATQILPYIQISTHFFSAFSISRLDLAWFGFPSFVFSVLFYISVNNVATFPVTIWFSVGRSINVNRRSAWIFDWQHWGTKTNIVFQILCHLIIKLANKVGNEAQLSTKQDMDLFRMFSCSKLFESTGNETA